MERSLNETDDQMATEKQARTRSSPRVKRTSNLASTVDQTSAFPDNQDVIAQGSLRDDHHDRIAVLAYALYERRGREEGCDLEDWFEAERQILNQERRNGGSESALGRF